MWVLASTVSLAKLLRRGTMDGTCVDVLAIAYLRARQLCINHLVHAYVLTEACAPLQKESIDAAHVQ
jgi:hypothetical protein